MANCQFCNDPVSLPYTCSLCGDRHCGKHRLPESHECLYIGTYNQPEYSNVKRKKSREVQSIKAGVNPDTGSRYISGGSSRSSRYGSTTSFWEASSDTQSSFYGGMILGLAATLPMITRGLIAFSIFVVVAIFVIAIGGLGFILVLNSRKQKGAQVGVQTTFLLWPVGIAVTIITSIIGLTFYTFGYFTNTGGSVHAEAEVAKRSIYTFAALALGMKFLSIVFPLVVPMTSTTVIALGLSFYLSSSMFAIYGLLMMLPFFSVLDGAKLYAADTRSYWPHLLFMIVVFIVSYFTFF